MERATTFFISHSAIAASPAAVIVRVATNSSAGWYQVNFLRKGSNRISRYTPAVTRVDECTRADTGVGAAIAAGSQHEKGTCALLVIAARRIIAGRKADESGAHR